MHNISTNLLLPSLPPIIDAQNRDVMLLEKYFTNWCGLLCWDFFISTIEVIRIFICISDPASRLYLASGSPTARRTPCDRMLNSAIGGASPGSGVATPAL